MDDSTSCKLFEMARTLLEKTGDELTCRETAVNLACSLAERGHADRGWIERALQQENIDVNSRDNTGKPFLHVLLQVPWQGEEENGLQEGVELLLDRGARVDSRDSHGQTGLHVAVSNAVSRTVLETLVQRSGYVNATNDAFETPLHLLVYKINDRPGSLDCGLLQTLLNAGADPFYEKPDVPYKIPCPLHLLLDNTDTVIENLDIFRGTCPRDRFRMVQSLLHYAISHGKGPAVKVLLQGVGPISKFSEESLVAAAQAPQDAEMKVDLLLQYGVATEAVTLSRKSLCHVAAARGSVNMLRKAVARSQSDVIRKDSCGNTPLHYTSSCENSAFASECVSFLVSVGAILDVENDKGYTPLVTALASKNTSVVAALIRAGACLPKANVAQTLTASQLSTFNELDVIVSFEHPPIAALNLSILMQQMSDRTLSEIEKRKFSELSRNLEKCASQMVSFDIEGATKIDKDVLYAAVENNQKQFISEDGVQAYIKMQWHGVDNSSTTSTLRILMHVLWCSARFLVLPFLIILYALPRYGRRYHIFADDQLKASRPSVRYSVVVFYHLCFVAILTYDSSVTQGLRGSGDVTVVGCLVFMYVAGHLVHEICQWKGKGTRIYFSSWANLLDIFTILLFLGYFSARSVDVVWLTQARLYRRQHAQSLTAASLLYALASFLVIVRLLVYLQAFATIGPILISFKRIIRATLSFLLVWGVLLVAFSVAMPQVYSAAVYSKYPDLFECVALRVNNSMEQNVTGDYFKTFLTQCGQTFYDEIVPSVVQGFEKAMITLLWALFGLIDVSDFESIEGLETFIGEGLLLLWLVIAVIVLINMMIAVVTDAFQSVQEHADVEWKFSIAEILYDQQLSPVMPPPCNILYYGALLIARLCLVCCFCERKQQTSSVHLLDSSTEVETSAENGANDVRQTLLIKFNDLNREEQMMKAASYGDLQNTTHTILQELNEIRANLSSLNMALARLVDQQRPPCRTSSQCGQTENMHEFSCLQTDEV